jgi:hypothetical protein
MHLNCKACGAQIRAEDMNLDHLVARCRHCHAVFGFREQLEADQAQPSDPSAPVAAPGGYVQGPRARPGYVPAVGRRRAEVPLPKGLSVQREEPAGIGFGEAAGRGKLVILRRWFSPKYVFLLFFCVVWDGFLLFWYSIVFSQGGEGPAVIMGLFPLLHVAVGVGLTYSTLAGFLNTTTLTVEDDLLRVRHRPVPWIGNRDLRVADLKQLYVREHVSRSRNGTSTTYRVHAVLDGGNDLKLLSGLEDASQALYVEQQIERHLGIVDEAVGGEM